MSRHHAITERIDKSVTGLAASMYLHCDFENDGHLSGVRISYKGKDGSGLDKLLTALGDTLTDILASRT